MYNNKLETLNKCNKNGHTAKQVDKDVKTMASEK